MFGILTVNKPAGWSSRDAVNRIQNRIRPAKVGHAGTLDPIATGLLVVCVGSATRLIQYIQAGKKYYRGKFILGQSSETDDIESEPTLLKNVPIPTLSQIEAALPNFTGLITQTPPAFSAIKIKGRRAYQRARQGEVFEIPTRQVMIDSLQVVEYDYPHLTLDLVCGSGTYVRSLGRDLARSLGSSAIMSALTRTKIGPFELSGALELEELTPELIVANLKPCAMAVDLLPQITLSEPHIHNIQNGLFIPSADYLKQLTVSLDPSAKPLQDIAALNSAGSLISILNLTHQQQFRPLRNFPL